MVDVGGDAVRAVEHPRPDGGGQHLGARPERIARPRLGELRALGHQPGHDAAVDGEHVVAARLDVPLGDQLDDLAAVLGRDVVVLREVLGRVVKLPAFGVEHGQRLGRDRGTERDVGLGERGPRPRADRPPAVVVDRPVTEHLEVLRVVPRRGVGVGEGMRETHPVQRCLRDTADAGGGFDPEHVEHRGDHVDDVRVLLADLAARGDACGPVHEERVTRATAVGFPLPAPERSVACPGPAPRDSG